MAIAKIEIPSELRKPTVSNPVEAVVSRTLRIKGTHPYSFRSGEWADIDGAVMSKPEGLEERPVFVCRFEDGTVDYIAVSDDINYELG